MKKAYIHIINGILVFCAAYFSLNIFISAFSIIVTTDILFFSLLSGTIVITTLIAFLKGKGVVIATAAVLILCLLNIALILDNLKSILFHMTSLFSKYTPIPVLFPGSIAAAHNVTIFFSILGIFIVLLLGITICLKHNTLLTVLITLPLILLSFVLINTQAEPVYLVGITAVYLAVFFKNSIFVGYAVNCLDDREKNYPLVAVFSSILAVLFVIIVFTLTPPTRYERSDQAMNMRKRVMETMVQMSYLFQDGQNITVDPSGNWFSEPENGYWSFSTNKVNIKTAGRRVITNKKLLEIDVTQPGTFYIKGFHMGDFDGKSWMQSNRNIQYNDYDYEHIANSRASDVLWANMLSHYDADIPTNILPSDYLLFPADPDLAVAGMNIRRVEDITDVDYVPYYSLSDSGYVFDAQKNNVLRRERVYLSQYDASFFHIPDNFRYYAAPESISLLPDLSLWPVRGDTYIPNLIESIYSAYTKVDSDTAQELVRIAEDAGIDTSAEREEIVDAVSAFIKVSGTYVLNPPVIPEDEDFALYFLQTSKRGYCIHFATAATLMLRSLDIPARFASGYVITVSQVNVNNTITLTDRNAHAWVEVFYDDTGWLPLEVTPSNSDAGIPQGQIHTPSRPQLSLSPTPRATPQAGSSPTQAPESETEVPEDVNPGFKMPEWYSDAIIILSGTVLIVIAFNMRRFVLIKRRKKRFSQIDTNKAVLYMWRYALQINDNHDIVPSDIKELALKARFSQHKLTEDEREIMLTYTHKLAGEIYAGLGNFQRFLYKYVRALI